MGSVPVVLPAILSGYRRLRTIGSWNELTAERRSNPLYPRNANDIGHAGTWQVLSVWFRRHVRCMIVCSPIRALEIPDES